MMWDDTGYLLSKSKYNENSIIAEVFTKEHGKITGIIFGGTSKKIKNYLQIGNKIYVNFNSKSENQIGYFKIEIDEAITPIYFEKQKKLFCIMAAMSLIKILSAESQKNIKIYDLIENFFELLKSKNWIKNYIYWELELFKHFGFDLDLKNLVNKKIVKDKEQYVSKSSSDKRIIPNFLINKNENSEELITLLNGLKLIGDFLEKTILKPNNLNQPLGRINFINTLK